MNFAKALLVISVVASVLITGSARTGQAECQGGFTYLVEADNGGHYALLGLPSNLRSQYANHTARISVNGTYFPPNLTNYLHPDPSFRGLVYVTSYFINESAHTLAHTVVLVSGTVTSTSTYTSQISPATVTVGTSVVTLTPISVTGWLDYSQEYCVTALLTSSGPTEGASGLSIPGFTPLAILLGLLLGLSAVAFRRTVSSTAVKRKGQAGNRGI